MMTDRELKKQLKKLVIVVILAILGIVALSVYTLGMTKAELSICSSQEYSENLPVLGIEEDEFKQYLSIFGNLVDEEYTQSQKIFNTSISFIDSMCSSYEVKTNEAGQRSYEKDVIETIAKEINAIAEVENMEPKENYAYDEENKSYLQNEMPTKFPYCIEITQVSKHNEKIEVIYKIAWMTSKEIAEYEAEEKSDFETKTIKATIINNTNYEYSKYCVSNIEKMDL